MYKYLRLKTLTLALGTIFVTVTTVISINLPVQEMLDESPWKWAGLYFLVMAFFLILGGTIMYRRLTPAVRFLEARENGEKPAPELVETVRKVVLTYPIIGTLRVGLFITAGVVLLGVLASVFMKTEWGGFGFYFLIGSISLVFLTTFIFFILKRSLRPVVEVLFLEDPDIWKREVTVRIPIRAKLIAGFACLVAIMGLLIIVTNSYFIDIFQEHVTNPLLIEELQATVWKSTLVALMIAAFMGAVIAWFISGDIAWPLVQITDAAESISKNERREGVPWISEDETGSLATAINRMATGMLTSLQGEVTRAEDLLDSMRDTVATLAKSADSIAEISSRQATGAGEQAAGAQEAASASIEISAVARRIAEHAKAVEQMSDRTKEAGENGGGDLNDAVRGIKSVAERFRKVSDAMRDVGERSLEIRLVLEIVEEISTQINLLAVNAALEAVGAGQAGRRFRQVAVEVERLAEKTSDAIGRIDVIVGEVSSSINAALVMAEEASEAAFASADVAEGLQESFSDILDLVKSTNQLAHEIELSTNQQNTACDQMVETIQGFVDSAGEVEADTGSLARSVQDLADQAERIRKLTESDDSTFI